MGLTIAKGGETPGRRPAPPAIRQALEVSSAPPSGPRFGRQRVESLADPSGFSVRLGWGIEGALALAPSSDVLVVVDVITFSTAVSVAVDRGCAVHPSPWDPEAAARMAAELGAALAVQRSRVDAEHPYSLSPATLGRAPRGSSIVLPSPNGSAVAAAVAASGVVVLAGCLRNAAAVSRLARRQGRRIAVIPAGERWPEGGMDPALEDLIGAGAVVDGLRRRRRSPEAAAAAQAYLWARRRGLRRTLLEAVSGREQLGRGYGEEIEWAAALNVSQVVPVLSGGAFRAHRSRAPEVGT
jgi:2-phosphosulfolactate phosphatase